MGRFQDPQCTIFVKNIEGRVTEEHLWELFLQAGPLKNVHIPLDRQTGNKRNFAFVTYRDEISVDYACQLFNQIRLFKKPIYCNPSKDKPSFNQTPSNRPGTPNTPNTPNTPPSSSNNSLIEGILNRSNSGSLPLTSTPYGKRKYSQDGRSEGGRMSHLDNKSDSRVVVLDDVDRDQSRYNNSNDRERGRYGEHDDRDRSRYDSSSDRGRGRYEDSPSYRSNSREERDGSVGYNRSDSRQDRDSRSSGQSSRYDRSNSFGNASPMHMHVLNQSHNQYGRQSSSPRENSPNVGPTRQDSNRNARKQRTLPY